QFLLLIPALVILPRFFGLNGVFLAYPVSDVGATLITFLLLRTEFASMGNEHAEITLLTKPQPER
ncbi:MAG: MATE family efflux transporter, partial [Firmicutes bacterium]|nr:MATE family efflux transporter [Bacillota bacterium]